MTNFLRDPTYNSGGSADIAPPPQPKLFRVHTVVQFMARCPALVFTSAPDVVTGEVVAETRRIVENRNVLEVFSITDNRGVTWSFSGVGLEMCAIGLHVTELTAEEADGYAESE